MDIQLLLEEFCQYSQSIKGYSPYTLRRYRYAVLGYCRMAQVSTLEEVTKENVRNIFYVGRTQRNWSVNTFILYKNTLMVFFRWCVRKGLLEANPIVDIEVPKLVKRIPPKLSKQAALRLLEVVYNYPYENTFLRCRNHALFATFIFAGLRKQELLNLLLTDVDVDNLTIFVRQGKGGKDRIIPMSFALAQSLKRYLAERKRLHKTHPEFFSSLRNNQRLTATGLKRLVTTVRTAAGHKFTVHTLRHTFATLMLEGGCDIYSLSKMMGHSDIQTTTIYLSASVEHLRAQMCKHPLDSQLKAVSTSYECYEDG